ncbi:MAG TPA: hypothetical protein VFS00_07585, partial [Polyangiaceae bacterium]|nr:hypothetical protein [Polyangiaceae bacterium]
AAAKVRAQKVLDLSLPLLPRLRVDVRAGAGARPSVKVDGEVVPAERLDAERPTDPGERLVEVSAPGYVKAVRKVKLAPGESLVVTLALEPVPALAPPAAGPAPRAPGAAEGGGPSPWAYVALGVGAAGVGIGAVLGATTLSRRGVLEDECPRGACPSAEYQGDIDAMKRTGNLSTLAFAVGGVGLGAGALLWWLGPSRPGAKRAGPGLTLGAWASGASAGLRGSFP